MTQTEGGSSLPAKRLGPFTRAGRVVADLGLDRPRNLVLWTIAIATAIRLITAALYGFGIGESYYLASARHPALSYFDQPPLSLWIAWATMSVTGTENVLVMRLPFVLMFAGTSWLMFRLGAVLFGEAAGAFAALLLNLSPIFAGMAGVWMQPDGPLMLFLVATMLLVAKLVTSSDGRDQLLLWLGVGVCLGLAMLAKYHAALLVVGIGIFALTSREHRRWFGEPGPYVAAVIVILIFMPVLIWNAQNDWVSFGFQSGRFTENAGLHPVWLLRMIAGQIGYIGPWVWLPMVWVFWLAIRRGPSDSRAWLLCCSAFLPVVLFTAASLWAPLGWHFHWQAPGYLMLLPLLGAATVVWVERRSRRPWRWLLGSAVATASIMLLLATQSATGWLRIFVPDSLAANLEWIADPTLEGLDWTELRDAIVERGFIEGDQVFAVAPQWHIAGKVDVQLGRDMPVVCLCDDPRNIAFGWNHSEFAGWDALIINPDGYLDDVVATYAPYFQSFETLAPIIVTRGGQAEIEIEVVLAIGYGGAYPLPLP